MYFCTGGKVTIGIGHAIETPALGLRFNRSIDDRPATDAEIRADYAGVASTVGPRRRRLRLLTQCRMARDTGAAMLMINFVACARLGELCDLCVAVGL